MNGMQPLIPVLVASVAQAAADVAWTEIVAAVALAVIALVAVGAAVQGMILLRSANRAMRSLDHVIGQLAPQTERVLHHAERVAEDASDITASARANVKRVNDTVDDLDDRLREVIDTADERVRRLGRVLDVVQTEVEDTLLDAAATARGIQTTADRLQRGILTGRPLRRSRGDGREDDG